MISLRLVITKVTDTVYPILSHDNEIYFLILGPPLACSIIYIHNRLLQGSIFKTTKERISNKLKG